MPFVGALQAVTYPTLVALMSRNVPTDAQGALLGGVASLGSLANVVGPLVMTQIMAYSPQRMYFTTTHAPVYFPGAAFVLAAVINLLALAMLLLAVRGQGGSVGR